MNRKRFIKKMMGLGFSRNFARIAANNLQWVNREAQEANRIRLTIQRAVYGDVKPRKRQYRESMRSYREWLARFDGWDVSRYIRSKVKKKENTGGGGSRLRPCKVY